LEDMRRTLAFFVRGLLAPAAIHTAPAGALRSFSVGGAFYLPASLPSRSAYFAAAAHLAAHARFGAPPLARRSLKPIQIVLVSVCEDARIERLARAALPGLKSLGQPFHTSHAGEVTPFPSLCARISRALFDGSYVDTHPLVVKARA